MNLYDALERNIFFTLTRKIVGNVLSMLLPSLLLLAAVYVAVGQVQQTTSDVQVLQITDSLLSAAWWILGLACMMSFLLILFMRHLFLRPIREMIVVLSAIRNQDGDISARLPAFTHDEISRMASDYNGFSDSLKRIISNTRQKSVNVALSATRLQQVLLNAYDATSVQQDQARQVLQASHESTLAIDDAARNTQNISEFTAINLSEVRSSSQELDRVLEQVQGISELSKGFQDTLNQLETSSGNITEILAMVKKFSEQTNLLALNASIEAARAGEAGRGFAVVADEVRNLSQQVQSATQAIDENILSMSKLMGQTQQGAEDILENIQTAEGSIGKTSEHFTRLVNDFEEVNSQLGSISSSLDQLSCTNRESHQNVERIASVSGEIRDEMEASKQYSAELEGATEDTQELLSRFKIGYGSFESIIEAGRRWTSELEAALQALSEQGHNVFDQHYVRINDGQEPAKYDLSYTDAYEAKIRPLMDSFLEQQDGIIYAIGVNTEGYAPAHHSKVSKPLSGDFAVDNLQSRHRRKFFASRAEQRRATHQSNFLLQTFIRDTGEVLNDLSFPVMVNGKRWGSLIMGFDAELLLDQQAEVLPITSASQYQQEAVSPVLASRKALAG